MISERYKTLIKLQRVLVITGFAMGVLLVVVVLREGIFSTTSLIMYGIVLLYVAIATHIPHHTIPIPFIGFTKLKYIAIFMVTLDILSIPQGNAGGHIAHLGGAVFGYIYYAS